MSVIDFLSFSFWVYPKSVTIYIYIYNFGIIGTLHVAVIQLKINTVLLDIAIWMRTWLVSSVIVSEY